ncbi:MAG: hypothetical protein Fur0037_06130 [Planctomycetota bacterium]
MKSIRLLIALLVTALPALAQFTHVIPNGFANTEGDSSNLFPWSAGGFTWPGIRQTSFYDSTNFTNASITGPITITRLRWRADSSARSWSGGSFQSAVIRMATAAVDAMSPSNNFSANFGPDLTTVYSGPVTVLTAPQSTPGAWVVDVHLTTPFTYDPSAGDLAIDVDWAALGGTNWSGGSAPFLDVDRSATTLAGRTYASIGYPNATGTTAPFGLVCEVSYSPPASTFTHVIPNGLASSEGNGANSFPWTAGLPTWNGVHQLCIYDSSNFTNAAITTPFDVSRLRWRADSGAMSWSGGTFRRAVIRMATASVDAMSPLPAFGLNCGPDLTTVYEGPVVVEPGTSSTPGPWAIDVVLGRSFHYDPALGDLVIDVEWSNPSGGNQNWQGGAPPLGLDVSTVSPAASRVYGSSAYPNVNRTQTNFGLVCELTCTPSTRELRHVIPNGFANSEGSTNNTFPWSHNSWIWPGLRTMALYDSTNFTNASIGSPITITGLRWRAEGGSQSWTGGVYRDVEIRMATSAADAMSPASSFGGNLGPDAVTVYRGPVTIAPAPLVVGTPGPWFVEVRLTRPFFYDPAAGDLAIDVDISNANGANWQGGTTPALDVDRSFSTLASRIWGSSQYPGTNGTQAPFGIVCEVSYVPVAGHASAVPHGVGCPAESRIAAYQQFAWSAFNLSSSTLQFRPRPDGSYLIAGSGPSWWPGYANNLNLGDDQVVQVTLPFSFPHAGGTTASIQVSSNGFLWLEPDGGHGCCGGDSGLFLDGHARIAAIWTDLNPLAAGGVYADWDPAQSRFVITWAGVPEYGRSTTVDAQIALYPSGDFDIAFGACTVTNHVSLTGYSMGEVPQDPGSVHLSQASTTPITTAVPALPLALSASGRPWMGSTMQLVTSAIPAGSMLGANYLSLLRYDPPIDLSLLGAPGCFQRVGISAPSIFLPPGVAALVPLTIPNEPSLSGVLVESQSAVLSPGANPLGLLTSNGLSLVLGPQ